MTINGIAYALVRDYSERTKLMVLSVLSVLLLGMAYFMLVAPDASYITIWLNDVMGLTDAAYRAHLGRVPSIDFHSTYGAAVYYAPALGFKFGFQAGAALSFGHLVVAAILLPLAVLASYRRIATFPATIFVVFLFLLISVPQRIGGALGDISYGVFYNRHGWAALAIVLVYYLSPRFSGRSDVYVDSSVQFLLLTFLFYNKFTFAAVALAFVVINGMTSGSKFKISAAALAAFATLLLVVEFFTGYNTAYLSDILDVVALHPVSRGGFRVYIGRIYDHAWLLTACLMALASLAMRGRHRLSDLCFVSGCVISGMMLLDMSGDQVTGLPGLIVIFLVCGELAYRIENENNRDVASPTWSGHGATFSTMGLLLLFVSGPMIAHTLIMPYQYVKTMHASSAAIPGQSGFVVRPIQRQDLHNVLGHDDAAHALFAQFRPKKSLTAEQYMSLIVEGTKLLQRVPHDDHAVVTFAHTNPFSFALNLRPTKYGFPLFWAGASFTLDSHPSPERFFSDTDYVMVPEVPYDQEQREMLIAVYGTYLEHNFHEIQRSLHWRLWARNTE